MKPARRRPRGAHRSFVNLLSTMFALACAGSGARADDVADFYRGKTINMIIGTGESGGAVEAYPRAMRALTLAQVRDAVRRRLHPGQGRTVVVAGDAH